MDFFEAQDRAKRTTWKLLILYLLAVVLIIGSIYLIALFVLGYAGREMPLNAVTTWFWNPGLFLTVSTLVIIVITSGTLFRIMQLRKGGSAVAEMLGGRKLDSSSTDPGERQLINIVEEMSIASGLPVPDIYLLDREENINAFAAGFGTDDAAVGVTRGAIDQLNRDELQGVIAHEFSHIFNGDMRLNIRLIGILNGILLLHIMGMILMRSSIFTGGGVRSSSGRGNGGQAKLVLILMGLALIIIGYIGMLFGRMIQAAVSRQREYLADAAAVQYTRNPDGIAGALEKIGRTKNGGKIEDGHSMELSHLFFANSFHTALDKLFATHPPLKKRIEAISPGSDPEQIRKKERIEKRLLKDRIESQSDAKPGASPAGGPLTETLPIQEMLLAAIGTMDSTGVSQANQLISEIPDALKDAAHEPFRAEALIYSLLLNHHDKTLNNVPDWCSSLLDHAMCDEVDSLLDELKNGKREWSLPLAEISIPALRQMSEKQYQQFRENIKQLIEQDQKVSLFEFALEKIVEHRLDKHFKKDKSPEIRHHHFKTLGRELSVVISSLAHISDDEPKKAWKAGVDVIKNAVPEDAVFLPEDEISLDDVDKALDEIALSANPVKRYLMNSMIHCVLSDDKISHDELELLRAIAEAIGCPIPIHVRPR